MKSHLLELIELECVGRYLFHGSGGFHDQLEPRQAHTVMNGQNVKDGKPAVFASELIDYAIFMALIDANWTAGCRAFCSYENGRLIFAANQCTIDQLTDSTVGFVHVLEKAKFKQRGGIEWISSSIVKPSRVIKVRVDDFQKTMGIMRDS